MRLRVVESGEQLPAMRFGEDRQAADRRFRPRDRIRQQRVELLRQSLDLVPREAAWVVLKLREQSIGVLYTGKLDLVPLKVCGRLQNGERQVSRRKARGQLGELKTEREKEWTGRRSVGLRLRGAASQMFP